MTNGQRWRGYKTKNKGRDFKRRRPDYIALSVFMHLVKSAGRYVVTNNPDLCLMPLS